MAIATIGEVVQCRCSECRQLFQNEGTIWARARAVLSAVIKLISVASKVVSDTDKQMTTVTLVHVLRAIK